MRKRNLNHQSQRAKTGKVSYTFNLWRDEEVKDNTHIPKDHADTSNEQDDNKREDSSSSTENNQHNDSSQKDSDGESDGHNRNTEWMFCPTKEGIPYKYRELMMKYLDVNNNEKYLMIVPKNKFDDFWNEMVSIPNLTRIQKIDKRIWECAANSKHLKIMKY